MFFVYFFIIHFFRNRTADQDQHFGKEKPFLEGIETIFQWDPFRGFGRRDIFLYS